MKKVFITKNKHALKNQAHKYFDMLWKLKYIDRNELYVHLSCYLKIEKKYTHMRLMDYDMCKQVVEYSIMMLNDMRRFDLDFGLEPRHPYYELITID